MTIKGGWIDEYTERLPPHEWDDDACCIHCGFDGAEWWWINRHTPPGEREPQPRCRKRPKTTAEAT